MSKSGNSLVVHGFAVDLGRPVGCSKVGEPEVLWGADT